MPKEKDGAYFRKLLKQRLEKSLNKVRTASLETSHHKERLPNVVDQACFDSTAGLDFRIRDRESKLARKISEALERLEQGTFGICEECGEEIPLRRLRARPVTTLCIECKEDQEAVERARGETAQVPDF
jgi:DnaK suppressor protein